MIGVSFAYRGYTNKGVPLSKVTYKRVYGWTFEWILPVKTLLSSPRGLQLVFIGFIHLGPAAPSAVARVAGARGGGVLPYMGYIGMCRGIGYGF